MPPEPSQTIDQVEAKSNKSEDLDDSPMLSGLLNEETIRTRNAILEAMKNADLEALAASINEHAEEADSNAHDALVSGSLALLSAWTCGVLLNIAKGKIKHGEFLDWLEKNYSSRFGVRTAQRYMILADKFSCLEDLIKWKPSLRQAYIACGILPEPPNTEKPVQRDKEVVARARLLKSVASVQTRLRRFSTKNVSLDDETKKQLFSAKAEIDELFKSLIG